SNMGSTISSAQRRWCYLSTTGPGPALPPQSCTLLSIGKHALWHPEILREVAARGHTIGGHTWSHANLAAATMNLEKATAEVEKGFSAVKLALGADPAPFFRFPYLKDPKNIVEYLGARNIAIFSHDLDSYDFKMQKPEEVVNSVMTKLDRKARASF